MPLQDDERQALTYLYLYELHQAQNKPNSDTQPVPRAEMGYGSRALVSLGGLLTRMGQNLEQRYGEAVIETDCCLS